VLGREMPVSSYAHDSEEMRKKITAIAIAATGDPLRQSRRQFSATTRSTGMTSTRGRTASSQE
jgi:hypothetical protein